MTEQIDRKSLETILLKFVANIVDFPFPQICKHLVAGNLLDIMENELGYQADPELLKAIVKSDDLKALEILNCNEKEKT